MWALRRASLQLKNRGLSSWSVRISCAKPEIERIYWENQNTGNIQPPKKLLPTMLNPANSYNFSSNSPNLLMKVCAFCSDAKDKCMDQETDSEDAFSELKGPSQKALEETDDDSLSELDLPEGETIDDKLQNELETLEIESNATGEKKSSPKIPISALAKAIMDSPSLPLNKVVEKWIEAGNELTQTEISLAMFNLRRGRRFNKALRLSEWLESTGRFIPSESNYASRVDLIAKVRGIHKAEVYIQHVPDPFRGEIFYRTFLANCVGTYDVKKSEDLFIKMKNLFPLTPFSCNQLLLLYKLTDKKKISQVLTIMEKENVKPSHFTYQILIDTKGQLGDIKGMEQVAEMMKSEGLGPHLMTQLTLARHYASNKLVDKSEAILKEIEGDDLVKNRWTCQFLLPVYGLLGKADEAQRIWRACEPSPHLPECLAAIEAFGRLELVNEAEGAFRKFSENCKKPSSKHFIALLKVYTDHKMVDKGKDLVDRMYESGCLVGPLGWDAIVRLYVGSGEVERADSILKNVMRGRKRRPLERSYLAVLEGYARRGDVPNAERVFMGMKRAGYPGGVKPYKLLLYAYINGKVPAYGFRERLKGDNVVLSEALSGLLSRSDAFRMSPLAELLD